MTELVSLVDAGASTIRRNILWTDKRWKRNTQRDLVARLHITPPSRLLCVRPKGKSEEKGKLDADDVDADETTVPAAHQAVGRSANPRSALASSAQGLRRASSRRTSSMHVDGAVGEGHAVLPPSAAAKAPKGVGSVVATSPSSVVVDESLVSAVTEDLRISMALQPLCMCLLPKDATAWAFGACVSKCYSALAAHLVTHPAARLELPPVANDSTGPGVSHAEESPTFPAALLVASATDGSVVAAATTATAEPVVSAAADASAGLAEMLVSETTEEPSSGVRTSDTSGGLALASHFRTTVRANIALIVDTAAMVVSLRHPHPHFLTLDVHQPPPLSCSFDPASLFQSHNLPFQQAS